MKRYILLIGYFQQNGFIKTYKITILSSSRRQYFGVEYFKWNPFNFKAVTSIKLSVICLFYDNNLCVFIFIRKHFLMTFLILLKIKFWFIIIHNEAISYFWYLKVYNQVYCDISGVQYEIWKLNVENRFLLVNSWVQLFS